MNEQLQAQQYAASRHLEHQGPASHLGQSERVVQDCLAATAASRSFTFEQQVGLVEALRASQARVQELEMESRDDRWSSVSGHPGHSSDVAHSMNRNTQKVRNTEAGFATAGGSSSHSGDTSVRKMQSNGASSSFQPHRDHQSHGNNHHHNALAPARPLFVGAPILTVPALSDQASGAPLDKLGGLYTQRATTGTHEAGDVIYVKVDSQGMALWPLVELRCSPTGFHGMYGYEWSLCSGNLILYRCDQHAIHGAAAGTVAQAVPAHGWQVCNRLSNHGRARMWAAKSPS